MWIVDFSPAVYDEYRLQGSVRIDDTYVWEYTIRTDFSVKITRYDTQYVRIFPRKLHEAIHSTYRFPPANYTKQYTERTDFPVQITQYDTL